jgi:hypothetical protein
LERECRQPRVSGLSSPGMAAIMAMRIMSAARLGFQIESAYVEREKSAVLELQRQQAITSQ